MEFQGNARCTSDETSGVPSYDTNKIATAKGFYRTGDPRIDLPGGLED